jgi:hypothetical protein
MDTITAAELRWFEADARKLNGRSTPYSNGFARAADAIERLERERDELQLRASRISEALDEGDGFWRSCSGCHELNDGYPTGEYSAVFRTHIGCGCSECGGLGVVWDDTDYADMGDFIAETDRAESEAATLRARVAKMEEALKYIKREAGDRSEKAWFRLETIMDEASAALTEEPKP